MSEKTNSARKTKRGVEKLIILSGEKSAKKPLNIPFRKHSCSREPYTDKKMRSYSPGASYHPGVTSLSEHKLAIE